MSYRYLTRCQKILGVGRNYVDHCKELGNPIPTNPIYFFKPTSSILCEDEELIIPTSIDIHHEVELAVIMGRKAKAVEASSAMEHVDGYALALDLTSRKFQNEAKKKGLPWTLAKGLDRFVPITPMIPASNIVDPHQLHLWLKINGEFKQQGYTKDMVFKLPYLISYLSHFMTLEEGDILLTGTPKGVGPLADKDVVEIGLEENQRLLINASWEVKDTEFHGFEAKPFRKKKNILD